MTALRLGDGAGRWALTATVLGTSLAFLDATIINIALPAIGAELDAPLAGLQWIVSGYTLSLAGLILLGGALGDRYGRRRVFLVGVIWFAVASLLCALAPNVGWLVGARILQGVGGALLTPGSLALIQASFHPDDRARAVGAWSGLGGVAAAAGPFLGGWLIEGPGWRWAFLINLPMAALVAAVTLRHVPESRDETATGRFDVAGAALGALALAGVTYALIGAGESSGLGATLAVGAVGAILAVAFVVVERRRANPMLPPSVFSSTQFTAVNVVTLVVYAALGGVFFFLTLQLQLVAGFSPVAAGASLLPVTLLMLVLSARAGGLAQRIGPRWPMVAGTAVAAIGVLLMARIGAGSSYVVEVLPAAAVFGLGLSLVVAPLTATVLATAEVRRAGIASGVNNAVARAAQLLAVAGLPLLVGLSGAGFAGGDQRSEVAGGDQRSEVAGGDQRNYVAGGDQRSEVAGGDQLGTYLAPALFSDGFRLAMYVCAGGLAAGSVLSLLTIRDDALRETPAHPEIVAPQRLTHCALDSTPLESHR